MKNLLLTLVLSIAATTSAQLLFHEGFEMEPADEKGVLGRQRNWQEGWNSEAPSAADLRDMNLHWESPFPAKGKAIQIDNSKQTAFQPLTESLNGKTFYFSYLFRFFQESDGTGQFRIRSDKGHILAAGFQSHKFILRAQGEEAVWGQALHRQTYMYIGQVSINEDGSQIRIAATVYTRRADIPLEAPAEWSGSASQEGPARVWNGLEFMVASQNVAYDDLRLGLTWKDVAGTRR